jgi:peptide/nickel transport system permease protein
MDFMLNLLEKWFGDLFGRRRTRSNEYRLVLRAFRRDKLAVLSLIILLLFALGALFAPYLTPYPEQGRGEPNMAEKFTPPGPKHPLGTDYLGRDLLARILFGGRSSLSIGFLVVAIAVGIGVPLGAVAGYFGGWVDNIIMRTTDVFLAFPPLLLAIAVAAALGASFTNAMIAIALTWWPWYTRLVRAQAISIKERSFVEAARGMGLDSHTIILRHILPLLFTPVLVQATMDIGSAILTAAAMNFIGLGVQPPTADWGEMVASGRRYFENAPWFAAFAGLAISLVTLAFNLLGDGLRDVLDPQTRRLG